MARKSGTEQQQTVNTLQSLLSMGIGGLLLCYVFVMKGIYADYFNSIQVSIRSNQIEYLGVPLINNEGASFVNNGQTHFQGDITNYGLMNCGDCTSGANYFNDKDDVQQNIDGTEPIQLYDAILDNANGLYLETELRIVNSFLFLDGMVETNRTDSSHFLHFAEGAIHSGASAHRYVDGYVGRTGAGPFTYPTGGNGGYFPVTITGTSSSDFFKVAYQASNPGFSGYSYSDLDQEMLQDVWNDGFWQIQGSAIASVQLQWDVSANLGTFLSGMDTLVVVGWDGTEWVNLGNAGTSGTLQAGTIRSDPIVPNAFSAFGLGKASGYSLPVEWIDFQVKRKTTDAWISWTTGSERNSAFFELERSFDGIYFSPIGRLPTAGTSNEPQSYQFIDPQITFRYESVVYYRIRQEDVNGNFDYSEVQQLLLDEDISGVEMAVFPNPAHDQVFVRYELSGGFQLGQIELFGQSGTTFFQKDVRESGETRVSVHNLPSGTYHIVLTNEDSRTSKKLIIR